MTSIIIYSVQVAFVFSILFIVYRIALSKLTFHTINRYILLSIIPISFLMPFLDEISPSISQVSIDIPLFEEAVGNDVQNIDSPNNAIPPTPFNYWLIVTIVYAIGIGLSLVKLFFNISTLILTKLKSKTYRKKGYTLVVSDKSETFSFFNWIFISEEKNKNCDQIIIEHEKAHIKLRHSLDVMLTELYITIFWFNPLVYSYRRSLKAVHEFQVDSKVLNMSVKRSEYLQLLLQNLEINKLNSVSSYFSYPTLKRRVDMISKGKSKQYRKLQYLALLPICGFLLLAFTYPQMKDVPVMNSIGQLEISHSPPSILPIKNKSKADITSHFGESRKHLHNEKSKNHGGIDLRASIGTPVIATADGTISKASLEGNWGNLIIISHPDGYQTWYAHLNGFAIEKNETVKKGDLIGYVGNTGLSSGPHLHYEVRLNGERVNPIDYIAD